MGCRRPQHEPQPRPTRQTHSRSLPSALFSPQHSSPLCCRARKLPSGTGNTSGATSSCTLPPPVASPSWRILRVDPSSLPSFKLFHPSFPVPLLLSSESQAEKYGADFERRVAAVALSDSFVRPSARLATVTEHWLCSAAPLGHSLGHSHGVPEWSAGTLRHEAASSRALPYILRFLRSRMDDQTLPATAPLIPLPPSSISPNAAHRSSQTAVRSVHERRGLRRMEVPSSPSPFTTEAEERSKVSLCSRSEPLPPPSTTAYGFASLVCHPGNNSVLLSGDLSRHRTNYSYRGGNYEPYSPQYLQSTADFVRNKQGYQLLCE